MRGIGFQFFALGMILLTLGVIWGTYMGASGDHTMVGPHAHLNLVGGVLSMMAGLYYNTTPQAAGGLAKVHLVLHVIAVAIFVPGIALAVLEINMAIVGIGSIVVLASVVLFLVIVLKNGLGRAA